MKTNLFLVSAVSFCLAITGCDKPSSGTSATKATGRATDVTPARHTSFDAVTQQLDPGGSVYAYLATDQWLAGLSTNILALKDFVLSLPEVKGSDRDDADRIFGLLAGAVGKSGLESLTGVGISGVQISPELHRTKLILHHNKGAGAGIFWNLFGSEPHALAGLNMLPKNTALAAFGDFDVAALWGAIESGFRQSGVPELADGIKSFPAEFEKSTQLSWKKLLESYGGEMGLIITLDNANMISLPLGEGWELPTPGMLMAIKVKNDLLFDRISAEMKKNQALEVSDEKGLKLCAMAVPLPLPMELKITIASSGDYFFLATSPALVREVLAVRSGKQPGLRQNAEFADLLKQLPETGNQFAYADKRFSRTILEVQSKALAMQKDVKPDQAEFLKRIFLNQKPTFGLSIGAHTEAGWQTVSVGNQDSSVALVAAPAVGVTAVGAAMLLPALTKAKTKAQSIACINNMKQINLAARIWSTDHEDKFPFQVSTSKGGTLELCERGGGGYDRNAYRHFQVLSNELSTPKLLLCPSDSKTVATGFADLQSWNVSYEMRTGASVIDQNPSEVILYCPIHHHKGLVDGSVQNGKKP